MEEEGDYIPIADYKTKLTVLHFRSKSHHASKSVPYLILKRLVDVQNRSQSLVVLWVKTNSSLVPSAGPKFLFALYFSVWYFRFLFCSTTDVSASAFFFFLFFNERLLQFILGSFHISC